MAKKAKKEEETLKNDSKPKEQKEEAKEVKEEVKEVPKKETKAKKEKTKPPKKKKSFVSSLIKWVIFLLIVAAIVAFAIYSLPIKPELQSKKLETRTGKIDDTIEINCNQYIRKVYYSVNPTKKDDLAYYEEVKSIKNGINTNGFYAKLNLEELNLSPGKGSIYFIIQGLFTKSEPIYIKYKFDIGYLAEFDESKLDSVKSEDGEDTGLYVVQDRLNIYFKESASDKKIKDLIEEYDGEIVGVNYLLGKYTVEFDSSNIEDLIEDLLEESIVDDVIKVYVSEITPDAKTNDYDWVVEIGELFDFAHGSIKEDWNEKNPNGYNWGLEAIDAMSAWDHMDEVKPIKVGVIDSALDYKHQDLTINKDHILVNSTTAYDNIDEMWDYLNEKYETAYNNSDDEDDIIISSSYLNHGTHVAGIIAATRNNKKDIAGVNDKADLYYSPLHTINSGRNSNMNYFCYDAVELSLSELVVSGCRVINYSAGSSTKLSEIPNGRESDEFKDVYKSFDKLFEKLDKKDYDFLFVKSAGNDGIDVDDLLDVQAIKDSKVASKHVLIVGNIRNRSSLGFLNENNAAGLPLYNYSNSSNYGEDVDIAAPGTDICSLYAYKDNDHNNDTHGLMSGTSMAAPYVTGVASLVYGINPDFTCSQVKEILFQNTDAMAVKDGIETPIVNARMSVDNAINYSGSVEKRKDNEKYGFLAGLVKSANGENPLANVIIEVMDENGEIQYYTYTGEEGSYEIILPIGTYDLRFMKVPEEIDMYDLDSGELEETQIEYIDEMVYDVEIVKGVTYQNVTMRMVEDSTEQGTVKGKLIDGITGQAIPNVTIKFRRGVNDDSGEVVKEATTDTSGNYTIELDGGMYTGYAEAVNYISGKFYVVSIPGETKEDQDGTLTPILQEGEIRAILTWGVSPRDLDSHITGPIAGSDQRLHVYYWNKNYYNSDGVQMVNLDLDDTSSYGPETVSIYHSVDGVYNYSVYDYTNRNAQNSSDLANSEAQVTLYVAGREEPYVYRVPNKKGNLWKVFSVDKDGNVTIINEVSTTSDFANID